MDRYSRSPRSDQELRGSLTFTKYPLRLPSAEIELRLHLVSSKLGVARDTPQEQSYVVLVFTLSIHQLNSPLPRVVYL